MSSLLKSLQLETLIETTLSRVFDHWKNREFVIITSDRKGNTKEENYTRRGFLMADIKALGLGYVPVVGKGQEEVSKGSDEVAPTDEEGFLVPNGLRKGMDIVEPMEGFLDEMLRLARKYDQWGITHCNGDGTGEILESSGKVNVRFTDFRVGISMFYTKLKNRGEREFYLESFGKAPAASGLTEAQARWIKGELLVYA